MGLMPVKTKNIFKDYFANLYTEMVKLNEYMVQNGVKVNVFTENQLARVKYASECDEINPKAYITIKPYADKMVKYAEQNLYCENPERNIVLMYMIDNKSFMRGGNFKNNVDRGYVESLKLNINQFLPNPAHLKQKPKLVGPPVKRPQVNNNHENPAENDNQRYRRGPRFFKFKPAEKLVRPNQETLDALIGFYNAEQELYQMGVGGVEHVDNQNPTQNPADALIVKTGEVILAYARAPYLKHKNDLSIRAKATRNTELIRSYLEEGTHLDGLHGTFTHSRLRAGLKSLVRNESNKHTIIAPQLEEQGIALEDALVESTKLDEKTLKAIKDHTLGR